MERFRLFLIPLTLLLLTRFSCSLNDEGKALLKHLVEKDSSYLLSNCIDGVNGEENPCRWSGVDCENGKVVSLNMEDLCLEGKVAHVFGKLVHQQYLATRITTIRKLLQLKSGNKGSQIEPIRYLPLPSKVKGGSTPPRPRSPSPPPPPAMTNSALQPSPVIKPSPPHSHMNPIPPPASKRKNVLLYSSISIGMGFIVIVVLVFLYRRYNKVVAVKPWATGLSGQLQKAFVTGVSVLKRQEIELACEDFSNIIGSLRDCILYKGTLSSGVEIAVTSAIVKSSKDWSKHAEAQFKQKIAMLSKVNHKNFVNLLGYCAEEEPFTRMMVFEYAPNGTLYDHLHNKEVEDLSWLSRLRIAMGIAYCLEHMHQLSPPVILGKLDSTSIHLTDDYAAKIADLELWSETVFADTETVDSPPIENQITDQAGIVYKYGLILLEIISRRHPSSKACDEFTEWSAGHLSGVKTLKDIVDPELKSFREEDVRKIADVIRSCLIPDPNGKPTMKEIAGRLREITAVHPEGATPKLSPLWWAELEIISTEAN